MKSIKLIFTLALAICLTGCGVSRMQKMGAVTPTNFDTEMNFTTVKTVILLPVKINGVTKYYLFDTGADLNLIQRDAIIGKSGKWTGASNRKMKLGTEIVKSLKIGDAEFTNMYSGNGDFVGLKEQIPNFGGLIGQPVISKANWFIDYPNKSIRITNKDLSDNTFQAIKIETKQGQSPYTFISINGEQYKVLIDFGSSSEFNVPKDSELAKKLLSQHKFKDKERERYTLGGLQKITEKVGNVPLIKLENIEFKNITTNINTSSQPRIGISFFKDCKVYIDNINGNFKIKKEVKNNLMPTEANSVVQKNIKNSVK